MGFWFCFLCGGVLGGCRFWFWFWFALVGVVQMVGVMLDLVVEILLIGVLVFTDVLVWGVLFIWVFTGCVFSFVFACDLFCRCSVGRALRGVGG